MEKKSVHEEIEASIDFGGDLKECHQQLDYLEQKYGKKYFKLQLEWDGGYDEQYLTLYGIRWETDAEYKKRMEDRAEKEAKKLERIKKRQEKLAKQELQAVESRKKLWEELNKEFGDKL